MLNLEGRELGGCRLVRVVGEGGMGEVYLAEQLNAGNRAVAVKVVRPDALSAQADDVDDIRERFKREVSLSANFNHPNILQVFYSGSEKDYLYIVMVYAEEGSLSDAIRGRSRRKLTLPLELPMALDIVSQVASALQYIHDRGVVHRDVKPGNVLIQIEPDGHWRMMLADFGVARGPDSTNARTQVAGTFTYMAPEQFEGRFSPATDQYALAVMTYQLLAGRPPFEGELGALTRAHMYDTPPPIRQFNPAVPPQVEAAIAKALEKDPERRFASVTAFARALELGATSGAAAGAPAAVAPTVVGAAAGAGAGAAAADAPLWPTPEAKAAEARKAAAARSAAAKAAVRNAPPRQSGVGRLLLASAAVIVLLAAVIGGGAYLNNQRLQSDAQATQATQTAQASQGNAALTQTAQAPTASPQLTATTSATSTPSSPTATPAPATPPPGVGAAVFTSPAPTCDSKATPPWTKEGATVSCVGSTEVDLAAPTPGSLACLGAQSVSQADGYMQATADAQSGKVELGVRQGVGDTTSGGAFLIKGYYLAVNPAQGVYILYVVNAQGKATTLRQASLDALPPHPFTFGLMFNGSSLTPYVNGKAYPSLTISTFSNGWVAICTDGSGAFSDVRLYGLSS